jgi:hypothetical protein
MRSLIASVLAVTLAASPAAAACTPPPEPDLAGLYTLEGVFEVGSQFMLHPDGRFEFMLAYGALDQYGRGCWRVEGETLSLVTQGRRTAPAQHYPDQRRFRGMVLIVQPDGLRWPLPGTSALYVKSGG